MLYIYIITNTYTIHTMYDVYVRALCLPLLLFFFQLVIPFSLNTCRSLFIRITFCTWYKAVRFTAVRHTDLRVQGSRSSLTARVKVILNSSRKCLNNRCCAGPFGLELARKRARRQVCNSYLLHECMCVLVYLIIKNSPRSFLFSSETISVPGMFLEYLRMNR